MPKFKGIFKYEKIKANVVKNMAGGNADTRQERMSEALAMARYAKSEMKNKEYGEATADLKAAIRKVRIEGPEDLPFKKELQKELFKALKKQAKASERYGRFDDATDLWIEASECKRSIHQVTGIYPQSYLNTNMLLKRAKRAAAKEYKQSGNKERYMRRLNQIEEKWTYICLD